MLVDSASIMLSNFENSCDLLSYWMLTRDLDLRVEDSSAEIISRVVGSLIFLKLD